MMSECPQVQRVGVIEFDVTIGKGRDTAAPIREKHGR
jgi:hypothetical protein